MGNTMEKIIVGKHRRMLVISKCRTLDPTEIILHLLAIDTLIYLVLFTVSLSITLPRREYHTSIYVLIKL